MDKKNAEKMQQKAIQRDKQALEEFNKTYKTDYKYPFDKEGKIIPPEKIVV